MARQIEDCIYSISSIISVPESFNKSPVAWLEEQADTYALNLLLAHADDGLIWGYYGQDGLIRSGKVFPDYSPKLRSDTLQQLRLFGEEAELLVWRLDQNRWQARLIDDQGRDETYRQAGWYFDEPQLLWGDYVIDHKEGFTLVGDGREGLHHAVPQHVETELFSQATDDTERWRPLRLGLRHYLAQDNDGQLFITQGRLRCLYTETMTGAKS